ncbi:MAG: phosphate acetyltransferase [Thiohalomonadales bacterium]
MPQDLYITGAGHGSGKSVIVLAMMEYFSGQNGNVGFFRPIIDAEEESDPLIQLFRHRYQGDSTEVSLYGCRYDVASDLIKTNQYTELIKRILDKYRRLQSSYDRILCVGSDYSYANSVLEFDFNADVANNLGCQILPIIRGFGLDNNQIEEALNGFLLGLQSRNCDVFATIINGVANTQIPALKQSLCNSESNTAPVYFLPEEPLLSNPTLTDIVQHLDAAIIYGAQDNSLHRSIKSYKVAAMQVPDFLKNLEEDSLVMTPGDRADIILACFAAYTSSTSPCISGLLLTGGLLPDTQIEKLLSGLGKPPFAVLSTPDDTFTTATKVSRVVGVLTADNETKIAAALGLVEAHVPLETLEKSLSRKLSKRVTPLMFEYDLLQRAKLHLQHIVLPEGTEERILRAAEILLLRGVVQLTLLGDIDKIHQKIQLFGLRLDGVDIVDPTRSELRQQFAETYYQLRQHKGMSHDMAYDAMADVSYFGTMMVHHGLASGMVSGSVHTTQHTIRPAFEIIKATPETSIVSSVFFMCLPNRVLVYGDCAINPNPDARQLADIAISSAATAGLMGVEARIAMLSYSTGTSGKGSAVDKVREATKIVRELRSELMIEGPIQYDAAIDVDVAQTKLPTSEVAGKATVFIFPDLNTGNNTYKAVQRSAGAVAIGPVLQGLNKPINDLSRGCTIADIVNTVAITAIQAQTQSST